jgi:hypothetical protein
MSYEQAKNYLEVENNVINSFAATVEESQSQIISSGKAMMVDAQYAQLASQHSVAEFLYQLIKMLTDDNRDCIEWVEGRIEVYNPIQLGEEVLHKYFRHSKYSSFQRQLNYFGFRKLCGKGKLSPCTYINDNTTEDLSSLLTIRRKTGPSGKKRPSNKTDANKSNKKRSRRASGSKSKKMPATMDVLQQIIVTPIDATSPVFVETERCLGEQFSFPSDTALNMIIAEQEQKQQQVEGTLIHKFLDPASQAMNEAVAAATNEEDFFEQSVSLLCGESSTSFSDPSTFFPDDAEVEEAAYVSDASSGSISQMSSLVDLAMLPTIADVQDHRETAAEIEVVPSSSSCVISSWFNKKITTTSAKRMVG